MIVNARSLPAHAHAHAQAAGSSARRRNNVRYQRLGQLVRPRDAFLGGGKNDRQGKVSPGVGKWLQRTKVEQRSILCAWWTAWAGTNNRELLVCAAAYF